VHRLLLCVPGVVTAQPGHRLRLCVLQVATVRKVPFRLLCVLRVLLIACKGSLRVRHVWDALRLLLQAILMFVRDLEI